MFRILTLCLALCCAATSAAAQQKVQEGDPVIDFAAQDAAMNAAIDRAVKTLPVFEAELDDPATTASRFGLKVAVPIADDGFEHIWTNVTGRTPEGDFAAVLANQPNGFKMNVGDPVRFPASMVSDWSYMKDGKLHGNYTTRVMIPQLDPQQAAELREMLAPLPDGN